MSYLQVKKLRDGDNYIYPLSVDESTVICKPIKIEHDIGSYKKGETIYPGTTLGSVLTSILSGKSKEDINIQHLEEMIIKLNKDVEDIYDIIHGYPGSFKFSDLGANGSQEKPYLIYDINDLMALKNAVNNGINTSGVYFRQVNDIDMGNIVWEGIGTESRHFKGVYDGNNKTIKNYWLKRQKWGGLFSYVSGTSENKCRIENITVECNGIDKTSSEAVEYGGAPLVGDAKNYHTAFTNIVSKGTIGTENEPISKDGAGICGRVEGSSRTQYIEFTNCVSYVDIFCNSSNNVHNGGMTGYYATAIKLVNCENYGNIYYSGSINRNYNSNDGNGGLAGNSGANITDGCPIIINNCKSIGKVISNGSASNNIPCGSLVGWARKTTLQGDNIVRKDQLSIASTIDYITNTAIEFDDDSLILKDYTFDGTIYYVVSGIPNDPLLITVPKDIVSGSKLCLNISILETVYGSATATSMYPKVKTSTGTFIEPHKVGPILTYIIP